MQLIELLKNSVTLLQPASKSASNQARFDYYLNIRRITEALTAWGKPVVPYLIGVLGDEAALVRQHAATILGLIGDPQSLEPLINALSDPHSQVRQAVIVAISYFEDARVSEALLQVLRNDPENQLRSLAAFKLGERSESQAVETLIELLQAEDSTLRCASAEALAKIGDRRALEPLIELLDHEDKASREWAAYSLGQLGDGQALKPLAAGLQSAKIRRPGIEAMGRLADAQAIPALAPYLKASDSWLRYEAAKALAQPANSQALAILVEALKDKDAYVGYGAIQGLEETGDERALDTLRWLQQLDWGNSGLSPFGNLKSVAAAAIRTIERR